MKFAKFGAIALATVSVVASPVAQAPSVDQNNLNVADIQKRALDVGKIVGDVENLLGVVLLDVEGIVSAAGVDLDEVLKGLGITLNSKRDEITGEIKRKYVVEDKRDIAAVVTAVEKLIVDILKSLVTLATDAGVSLLGELFNLGL